MIRLNLVIFAFLALLGLSSSSSSPPQNIPNDLLGEFSANHTVPIEYFYVDDSNAGSGTHFTYSEADMERFISGANRIFEQVRQNPGFVPPKFWFYTALQNYSSYIVDQSVCVFGSMEPWVEAALIAQGAKRIVSIDYNRVTYAHKSIETIAKDKFEELYSENSDYMHSFSLCVAASSFDHDGLGRYGDPIDPDADLMAMKRAKQLLSPTGVLLLSVPIGPDVVVFNLLRRYGPSRLPKLIEGWNVVSSVGWIEDMLKTNADWRRPYEPVLALMPSDKSQEKEL